MDRKMRLMTDYLDGKRTVEDLVDAIVRLENELKAVKITKTKIVEVPKITSIDLTNNEYGTLCDIAIVDNGAIKKSIQIKLGNVPSINQKLYINIDKKTYMLFNIIDVVNGIEIDKENKKARQTVMLFVEEFNPKRVE